MKLGFHIRTIFSTNFKFVTNISRKTNSDSILVTNLSLKSEKKLCRIEERLPSAATSKFPTISIVSSVCRTLALTLTDALSSERQKERKRWPQKNMFEGNALKRRPWRSAHSAALKLNFSSLVSVQLTFFSLSVAWFCLQTKTHDGNVDMLYLYYIVTYQW